MTPKYFYKGKRLRCRVRYKDEQLNLRLQVYKGWWVGWVNVSGHIDIQISRHPLSEATPKFNPMTLPYLSSGSLEVWAKGTFNLEKRVDQMLSERLAYMEHNNQIANELKAML